MLLSAKLLRRHSVGSVNRRPNPLPTVRNIAKAASPVNVVRAGAFMRLSGACNEWEVLNAATARANRLGSAPATASLAAREVAVRQIETFVSSLDGPHSKWLSTFTPIAELDPYERELIDLSLQSFDNHKDKARSTYVKDAGIERYESIVNDVRSRLARLQRYAKQQIATIQSHRTVTNASEVSFVLQNTFAGLRSIYLGEASGMPSTPSKEEIAAGAAAAKKKGGKIDAAIGSADLESDGLFQSLLLLHKTLRSLQTLSRDSATVMLIGAPNVGKSSLVRLLSTAQPEVRNYAFTTKAITVGHMFVTRGKKTAGGALPLKLSDEQTSGAVKVQVTDTPGLLYRTDEQRNRFEHFTLALLTHFGTPVVAGSKTAPSLILFITDVSGHCGFSLDLQLKLRDEMFNRFGGDNNRWVDVLTKVDLGFKYFRFVNTPPSGLSASLPSKLPVEWRNYEEPEPKPRNSKSVESPGVSSSEMRAALKRNLTFEPDVLVSAESGFGADTLRDIILKRLQSSLSI